MTLSLRFEKNLRSSGLVKTGDKVYVACSGGPDSVALLHLLLELRNTWDLRVGVLHLNHQLRKRESAREEKFVAAIAKKNGVPFVCGKAVVVRRAKKERWSVEEAARALRYEFFVKEARKRRVPKIALGHHLNDQAETVLMRLVQGTGLTGLQGIRRSKTIKKVKFIRPLLDFRREEILRYLEEKDIPFCHDSSNLSEEYLRNRIRKTLMPLLAKDFNPRIAEALARIPSIVHDEAESLKYAEDYFFRASILNQGKSKTELDRELFESCPDSLRFRILTRILREMDPKSGINYDNWQKFRPSLERQRTRYSLKRDIDLNLTPSKVIIYKKKKGG